MNAVEFVNKFGICEANKAINKFGCTGFYCHQYKVFKILIERSFCDRKDNIHTIDMSQVKQIVDAFDLVETGLPELKKVMFSNSKDLDYVKNWILTVSDKLLTEKGARLKQAIELVEQCQ